jgi:hypothetical protein
MVDRIQVIATMYMKWDGLWRIVCPGNVCDVPSAAAFSPTCVKVLSPGEAAGSLASHGGATPVRPRPGGLLTDTDTG